MKYYLNNPYSNNGINITIPDTDLIDASKVDYKKFFSELNKDDEVVLIGGDGTLNYFINEVDTSKIKNNIYLYGNGTGNDFLKDINEPNNKEVLINQYLINLPTVKVKDLERKFINNMGFGIDGYCCEIADQIKEKTPNKQINYTTIAIKGLIYDFKPRHVELEIDGEKHTYENAWLAPTMKGRYYGGGMMMAPNQDRNSNLLTVVVYDCKSKIKSLMNFPSIFEGKHIDKTDMVHIFTGNKVHVKFSEPCAGQIDGETVLNMQEYWAEL